jgi:predicted lipoprotein
VRFLAVFRTNNGTRDQGVCNSDPESELFQMGALMRGDEQAVFNDNFPDPAEQAEALLETCQGDVCEAQTIATTNFKYAKYQADQLYWSRVEVLLLQQGPAAVMERLANSRLRRRTQRR